MFGYVKPYTPELKMREYELYRAIYCGLCRSMGKRTGQTSRFTLNYDFVFLAAVRLLATGEEVRSDRKVCIAHPFRKRQYICDNEAFRYSADVSAFLSEGKLNDDIVDEGGIKRLRALVLHPAVRHMVKKASASENFYLKEVKDVIPTRLGELSELEREGCTSLDRCAEVFGSLTAELFAAGLSDREARIAREIGRGVGRFIYVCDACDDVCDDCKRGSFNPILTLYGGEAVKKDKDSVKLSVEIAESLYTGTLLDLERCAAAAELLCDDGDKSVAALVRNILYLGMPEILKSVLVKRCGENFIEGFIPKT